MRLAIIGLGNQGKKRLRVAGSDVVATADPLAPDAQYRAVDQIPLDQYDAACVCTPDDAKVSCLRHLLANGKHVLVEKPVLASASEFAELQQFANNTRATSYTAYNHRFEPHLVRAKQVLESGVIGSIYLVRVFYGNGTARDVFNSPWRDQGTGVLPDLGSHLIDMMDWFFGNENRPYRGWAVNRFETRAPSHVVFGAQTTPAIVMEATMVSWRNTFTLDIFGEHGSVHVFCLCKWGPSTFTVRKRVLPSGRPTEESETLSCPDPTWELEYNHFKNICNQGITTLSHDHEIQMALNGIASSWPGAAT